MRKPRDFDAELDALDQKARTLRQRKIMQLGELVIACGADALPIEILAGALLAAVASKDDAARAGWSRAGDTMFRGKIDHDNSRGVRKDHAEVTKDSRDASPDHGSAGKG